MSFITSHFDQNAIGAWYTNAAPRILEDQSKKAPYRVGEKDTRHWGSYEVLEVEETNGVVSKCVKTITVNPKKALSLQIHTGRAEKWIVEEGELTAIVDGKVYTVKAGEEIDIPRSAIHCMINMSNNTPLKIREIQTGICVEDDNYRLVDMDGRAPSAVEQAIHFLNAVVIAGVVMKLRTVFDDSVTHYLAIGKKINSDAKPSIAMVQPATAFAPKEHRMPEAFTYPRT